MQRLTQVSFAVLALSCALLCTVQSAEPMPLSLTSGTCSGIPFTDLGQKFHYDAQVAITSGDANCIRVSKLYVQDACINERNNELGLNTVKQVSCDQTDSVDPTTCESVFKSAPTDAIVNGSQATLGYYDAGDVCAAEANSYIYVQNTCANTTTEAVALTVTVTPSDYQGSICVSIAGHHINGVGIALIIVAILIVVAILALMCYCCCCRW